MQKQAVYLYNACNVHATDNMQQHENVLELANQADTKKQHPKYNRTYPVKTNCRLRSCLCNGRHAGVYIKDVIKHNLNILLISYYSLPVLGARPLVRGVGEIHLLGNYLYIFNLLYSHFDVFLGPNSQTEIIGSCKLKTIFFAQDYTGLYSAILAGLRMYLLF